LQNCVIATAARAQDWKGNGRMSGKVIDEQNKPLEDVRVVASLGASAASPGHDGQARRLVVEDWPMAPGN
jgi:hypothetical protein